MLEAVSGVHGPKEVQALIKEAERPFDVQFQRAFDASREDPGASGMM